MKQIGICGAGQMGAAAAVSFQRAGYPVLLWARNATKIPAIRRTLADLDAWLNTHVGEAGGATASTEVVNDLSCIDDRADVIMDAIAEDMGEKVSLFKALAGARDRGATFLTTTSGLSITELGRQSETGTQLVGTHFWNPPHLMPLVEVVRGQDSDPGRVDDVCEIINSIGKIPVRCEQDIPGFIGNRLLHAMWREAIYLVQRGIASPADIDRVARLTFGLRMPAVGPLENIDLVGVDLVETIHQYLPADLCNDPHPLPLLTQMKNEGLTFHDWELRDMETLVESRDRQIVHQLNFLKTLEAL
jgi:3-hydroxybutyryl-CoA dehydrogenase